MEEITEDKIFVAYSQYEKRKATLRKYYENHKDKFAAASKRWFAKMKEDPEKYAAYLEKRKKEMKERRSSKKETSPPNV